MVIKCSICANPDRPLIDRDLLKNIPSNTIANQYKISYWALRRHAIKHLQLSAETAKKEQLAILRKTMPELTKSTLQYYTDAIQHFFSDPENLDRFSGADIIKILEQRSKYLGEEQGPTKIEIRWGAGLDLDQFTEPTMKIEIPMEKLQKEAQPDKKEDKIDENNTT